MSSDTLTVAMDVGAPATTMESTVGGSKLLIAAAGELLYV
jgi:hypothetical protein